MDKPPHRMASSQSAESRQVVNKLERDDRKSDITPNSKKTRNIKRERQPWPPTEIPDLGQAHRNVMGLN